MDARGSRNLPAQHSQRESLSSRRREPWKSSGPVMAVTGLRCNPPPWRFHRGPDLSSPPPPLHKLNVHPFSTPEAQRPTRALGTHPSLTNRTQQRKKWMAAPRCVCVCSCHSRVSFLWVVTICLPMVNPRVGLVVAPEDTWPQENDRRCALPLGCGFCGIPKRVEPVM